VTRRAAAWLFLLLLAPLDASANANDDLLRAAAQGDAAAAGKALARGARLATADQLGRTALHLAAARGSVEVISLLLDRGAPAGARDSEGLTPFLRAARSLRGEAVALFLSRGADRRGLVSFLGVRDASGRTLLHAAALKGAAPAVAVFCSVLGEADAKDASGRTPLSLAAASAGVEAGSGRRGYLQAIRALLEEGADPQAADAQGRTPLWYAVHADDGELALLLSEKGVDVEAVGEAYGRGDSRIARILTERITDPQAADATGGTYLHAAARQGLPELAARALALGVEVDRADRFGRTPLALAVARGDEEMVRILLEGGADPNRPGERGVVPLVIAAREGAAEVADALLAGGAEVSPAGRTTALHAAVQGRNAAMAGFLISRGADLGSRDEQGNTPLCYAVETRTGLPGLELVRLLLDQGAPADGRCSGGATPLLRAAAAGKREEAALLLSRGADPAAADDAGRTPLGVAASSGDKAMLALLRTTAALSP
jgi:ankyrin repeat protein